MTAVLNRNSEAFLLFAEPTAVSSSIAIDPEAIKKIITVVFSIASSAIVGAIGMWGLVRTALKNDTDRTQVAVESTHTAVVQATDQAVANYSKLEDLESKVDELNDKFNEFREQSRQEAREDRRDAVKAIERVTVTVESVTQTVNDLSKFVRSMRVEDNDNRRKDRSESGKSIE